ncbi:MAG: hypothetical protein AB7H96_13840 [Vicinamibacterales bacterium]
MRTTRTLLVTLIMFALALPSTAFAQSRHVADPSAIGDALTAHVADEDAARATIRQTLARPDVRDVAARSGIDMARVDASVDTLAGSTLTQAAAAAQQVDRALVGGASTIVISTTTIIVALLLIILLVVAVD